ncbi:MAG: PH domain-containing protein [Phycisphaerae bacterium]|nr:PH domain-containing protein [Tepidisphaeraceae bacterium]
MSQAPQGNAHNAFEEHAPHKEADDKEEVYFSGSPMVRGAFGKFLLSLLIGLAIMAAPFLIARFGNMAVHWIAYLACILVGLGVIIAPILVTRSIRYRITNYRIDYERGILGKKIDTLELWHVEDVRFEQSFFDRLLGVGTVTIFSNDDTNPQLPLRGLPDPRPLFDKIKQRIIAVKRQRGVVKMDIGGGAGIS